MGWMSNGPESESKWRLLLYVLKALIVSLIFLPIIGVLLLIDKIKAWNRDRKML